MKVDLGIFDGSESGKDHPFSRAFVAFQQGVSRAEAIVTMQIKRLMRRTCDFYIWIEVPEGATKAVLKVCDKVKSFPVNGGRIYWNYPAGFAIYASVDLWFEGSTETNTKARIAYISRDKARKMDTELGTKRVMTEIRYGDVVAERVLIYEGVSSFVGKDEVYPNTVKQYLPTSYVGKMLLNEVYPKVVDAFSRGSKKVEVDARLDSKYLVGFDGYYERFEAPLNATMIIRVDDNEVSIPVDGGWVDWRWFPESSKCSLTSLRFFSSTGENEVWARMVYVRSKITQKLKGISPVFYKGRIVAKVSFDDGHAHLVLGDAKDQS
jgi:hypothetical protein